MSDEEYDSKYDDIEHKLYTKNIAKQKNRNKKLIKKKSPEPVISLVFQLSPDDVDAGFMLRESSGRVVKSKSDNSSSDNLVSKEDFDNL